MGTTAGGDDMGLMKESRSLTTGLQLSNLGRPRKLVVLVIVFTGFYGFASTSDRNKSWDLVQSLNGYASHPWVLFGDFNEPFQSHSFTPFTSDHVPILLSICQSPETPKREHKQFCFEESWLQRGRCEQMNDLLLADYSDIEIKDAVFQMNPHTAPGPDGMSPLFFQRFWPVVGHYFKAGYVSSVSYVAREGLPLAFQFSWTQIIVECDALRVVQAIRSLTYDSSAHGLLFEEIK
ncbi:hypothetical protein D8674_004230 [Pyrus ussuriensis x Pyrus communis]|uniref:Endonuclease/exonuclease/phosphatase domain-containing protein n=1 Tax=Pyrus ussuriensis x Pyrus communis TaxID=2448454 RepID=A0A5N5FJA7_9ROSA|nr:hypothetical protein D8674_004230 [Pyrus ussuriensis x Pyrus communis]